MTALPGMARATAGVGSANLAIDAVKKLGLGANLLFCLDAADAASYSSGQTWADRSGNGLDFHLGATSGSEATDPTFNGSAGSLPAYFSFDGGDQFTLGQTNPAGINALHKDNALYTAIVFVRMPSLTAGGFMGTRGLSTGGNVGWLFGNSAGGANGRLSIAQRNGTDNQIVQSSAGFVHGSDVWQMLTASWNEAGGATGSFFGINDAFEDTDGAYTSPSSSDASFALQIGARGNGSNRFGDGTRLSMALLFGAQLTKAQVAALFNAVRGRHGV